MRSCTTQSLLATRQLLEADDTSQPQVGGGGAQWLQGRDRRRVAEFALREADLW
eukprot:SAG22_NODE_177_length_16160_cov_41.299296_7_plen_54_part_00